MTRFQIDLNQIHRGIVSIIKGRSFYADYGYSEGFLHRIKQRYREHNILKEMNKS